jgi:hypothetical protein
MRAAEQATAKVYDLKAVISPEIAKSTALTKGEYPH